MLSTSLFNWDSTGLYIYPFYHSTSNTKPVASNHNHNNNGNPYCITISALSRCSGQCLRIATTLSFSLFARRTTQKLNNNKKERQPRHSSNPPHLLPPPNSFTPTSDYPPSSPPPPFPCLYSVSTLVSL